jgi:hypothetical protein
MGFGKLAVWMVGLLRKASSFFSASDKGHFHRVEKMRNAFLFAARVLLWLIVSVPSTA